MRDGQRDERVIGWVDIPHATTQRLQYETAAWYTLVAVPAGRYLLTSVPWTSGSRERVWLLRCSGTIVDQYMPALWGGVPIGSSPQGRQSPAVGRSQEWSRQWTPTDRMSLARDIIRLGGFPVYADGVYTPTVCRFHLFGGLVPVSREWWSCHYSSYPRPHHEGYVVRSGEFRRRLALPARVEG